MWIALITTFRWLHEYSTSISVDVFNLSPQMSGWTLVEPNLGKTAVWKKKTKKQLAFSKNKDKWRLS